MAFIDELRVRTKGAEEGANGIPMPSSIRFDRNTWQAAFAATNDGSQRDRSAFEAGLFVDEQLAHLRKDLRDLEGMCKRETTAERSRALVGFLNMECTRQMARIHELARQSGGPLLLDEMVFGRLVPGGQDAPGYTVEEVSDLLTDCIRHPLRAAIAGKGHGRTPDWQPSMPARRAIDLSVHVAMRYDVYEKLWAHVRWLDSAFQADGKAVTFDEKAGELAAEEHLNRARRSYDFNQQGLESLFNGLPVDHALPLPKFLLTIGGSDPSRLQCLAYNHATTRVQELMRAALGNWSMSSTIRYEALRGMRHSVLGCSIGDLLSVWIQLAVVAFQCQMRLMHRFDDEGLTLVSDPLTSAVFDADELRALIAQATGLDSEVVAVAINRFTFGKDGVWTADLWERPLVHIDGGLALAWSPLINGNIGRLIPALVRDCKEVSEAYARRGHEFEDEVVDALRNAASNSRLAEFKEAVVLSARLDPEDDRVGDVDCVLVVGDTAFCLECRSVKHSATAYEQWDVADDLLNKKAAQASRKREYLKANPSLVTDLAQQQGTPLRQPITRFIAVVVSNCFFFEGTRELEPYFVHVNTLVNMLSGGPVFETVESGRTVSWLVDRIAETSSAADAMAKEIQRPAKAEYYHSLLVTTTFHVPTGEASTPPATVRQLVVKPPTTDTIGAVLQKCSFARWLRPTAA